MKRLAVLMAVGFSMLAVTVAQAADVNNHLTLDQVGTVVVGATSHICAHADRTFINTNDLRWTYHNRLAKVKYVPGDDTSCRLYRAPQVTGWDRVKVTFVYHGQKYVAYSKVDVIQRP